MKKLSILLFILLSVQLYGCSSNLPENNEVISFAPEASSPEFESLVNEENSIKENDLPAEEYSDDNAAVSVETGNSPVSINSTDTENIGELSQRTTAQQEEGITADNGYYSIATDIPSNEVEHYAANVRQQFLDHDWSAISSEISYPITISGVTYNSGTDFLDACSNVDSNLNNAFFSALESEDCVEMFCNYEGIMMGETGQIWIGEVLDADFTSQGLKIIGINGLFN
ncbi:MAG: hypothetical protein K2N73_07815 [Lachnospiraceae bacterium]|nr:hypothetical protein [Lachnospiraceae bacterium]